MATISFLTLQILNTWIESNNGLHNGLALSKGGKSQATGLSRYSRGNFISAGVDGIVNLFEEFFLLEGCGVGLYSLSFYNLSVGSPYARPKKNNVFPKQDPNGFWLQPTECADSNEWLIAFAGDFGDVVSRVLPHWHYIMTLQRVPKSGRVSQVQTESSEVLATLQEPSLHPKSQDWCLSGLPT